MSKHVDEGSANELSESQLDAIAGGDANSENADKRKPGLPVRPAPGTTGVAAT